MHEISKIYSVLIVVDLYDSDRQFNMELADLLASVLKENHLFASLNFSRMSCLSIRLLSYLCSFEDAAQSNGRIANLNRRFSDSLRANHGLSFLDLSCMKDFSSFCLLLACVLTLNVAVDLLQALNRHPAISTLILSGNSLKPILNQCLFI
jgi:hypothetical protein